MKTIGKITMVHAGDYTPVRQETVIDVSKLQRPIHVVDSNIISPSEETVHKELAKEHAAEPIKSMDDLIRVSNYLLESGRYRDNMLFITGINFGLRISDLLTLRFSDIINENLSFKDTFPILEKKTKNTRKKMKNRYVTINNAVIEAVTIYLEHTAGVSLSDYMFQSESNHGKAENKPMTKQSVDRILKAIGRDLQLPNRMATHTLRKTFGYFMMMQSNNDPRKLLLLQKIFGHATSAQTLDYIGITEEEIHDAYINFNIGSKKYNYLTGENNLLDSTVIEENGINLIA